MARREGAQEQSPKEGGQVQATPAPGPSQSCGIRLHTDQARRTPGVEGCCSRGIAQAPTWPGGRAANTAGHRLHSSCSSENLCDVCTFHETKTKDRRDSEGIQRCMGHTNSYPPNALQSPACAPVQVKSPGRQAAAPGLTHLPFPPVLPGPQLGGAASETPLGAVGGGASAPGNVSPQPRPLRSTTTSKPQRAQVARPARGRGRACDAGRHTGSALAGSSRTDAQMTRTDRRRNRKYEYPYIY